MDALGQRRAKYVFYWHVSILYLLTFITIRILLARVSILFGTCQLCRKRSRVLMLSKSGKGSVGEGDAGKKAKTTPDDFMRHLMNTQTSCTPPNVLSQLVIATVHEISRPPITFEEVCPQISVSLVFTPLLLLLLKSLLLPIQ
jgi:hypothetical protein